MRFLILIILIGHLTLSCNEDKTEQSAKPEKVVQEITSGDRIRDIIRNPVDANESEDTVNVAKMVFEEKRFDFGTVNEGDVVKHTFKFVNEGTVPLIIAQAKSTCGCTIPEWPKNPIAPGEGGVIDVRFDTKNKKNRQGKPITIIANTYPRETILQLKGQVTPKE